MLLSLLSNLVMIQAAPQLPYYPFYCDDTGIIALDETECFEELAELQRVCLTIQSGKLTVCQSVTVQSQSAGQTSIVNKAGNITPIIATSSNSKNNIIFTYGL